MNQRLRAVLGLLLAAGLCGPARAVESGAMLRSADLKARPFLDAETVTRLPERALVEVIARQGPWMQVRHQGKEGYVRMLQVRLNVSDSVLARSPAASAPPVRRTSGSSTPMVTTGVRGFDEQSLKDAEPAPEQFQAMVGYAASAEQARKFAHSAQLVARQVPYYDASGVPVKEGK
jgi:hypothetical protein